MSHKSVNELKYALVNGEVNLNAAVANATAQLNILNATITTQGGTVGITNAFLTSGLSSLSSGTVSESIGAFANYMINHGKDMILVSDQADQFICIANDTFSRIIDVYATLQKDFSTPFVPIIASAISKVNDISVYIQSQIAGAANGTIVIADVQTEVNRLNVISQDSYNNIVKTVTDTSAIYLESFNILNQFKEVLKTNATVGIALSLSKTGYKFLVRMTQLHWAINIVEPDDIVFTKSGTLASAADSTVYPIEFLEKTDNLKKIAAGAFLEAESFKIPGGTIRISQNQNKKDSKGKLPKSLKLPDTLEKLKLSMDPNVIVKSKFTNFDHIFEAITFAEYLTSSNKLTDAALTTYHATLDNSAPKLAEFLAEFSDIKKHVPTYSGGTSAPIIAVAIPAHKSNFNFNLVNNLIANYRDTSFEYTKLNVDHLDFFNGKSILKSASYNKYIKDIFDSVKTSADFLTTKNGYITIYDAAYQIEPLNVVTTSGTTRVSMFTGEGEEEKLNELFANFHFKLTKYVGKHGLVYAEGEVAKHKFIFANGKLYMSFDVSKLFHPTLTSNLSSVKHIVAGYKVQGYLTMSNDPQTFKFDYLDMVDELIDDDFATGVKSTKNVKSFIKATSTDNVYDYGYTIKEKNATITYSNDYDRVERITTNITNVYREQLLSGEIDFSAARLKSIIGALDYLAYQKKFDDYIELTWDSGIPRIVQK